MDRARSAAGFFRLPAAVLLALAGAGGLPAQGDITGEWEVRMGQDGRERFGSLSISRRPDGTYSGKWGATDLSEVKFDGQKLTFVRTLRFGDREFHTDYAGTLKDGVLSGELSSERGSFPAIAARRKPKSPALGRWALRYSIAERDIDAVLAVSEGPGGALEGRWTSSTGEHVVSNVKFQDGRLTLDRRSKIGEREFESTFEGVVEGHGLAGTIKSERGEVPAPGRRIGADLVGRWELTSTSERGPRTSLLTVHGDLTGRYEVFGAEVPLRDLKVEGSRVSFSVEAGFGDQSFTLEFKGQLEGKTLQGEVSSPRGDREVRGRKLDPAAALVGTWEITRESPRGARTATLVIKEDLTGTYTARESTVNVTDLRFEEGRLSFKVTLRFGEREVPMEFKGRLEGNELKGQFISERGAREATGKKVGQNL